MNYSQENGKLIIRLEGSLDASNATEVENEVNAIVATAAGAQAVELDAQLLERISTSGLRAVMRLHERLGDVSLVDVSDDVYDVFEKTGLAQRIPVRRRPRQISIEGCELIGKGETAAVYRLNDEDLVKVYSKKVFTSIDMVQHDFDISKATFVAGIPTAIPYETVRVGDEYGTVFEMLKARGLLDIMLDDREHLAEWATRFAREIKRAHQVKVDPRQFGDIRARLVGMLSELVGRLGTQEEIDTLMRMYEILPERHTFLHADCHPGNMMVSDDGEFFFIDLSSACFGHPIIDISSMWMSFKMYTLLGREAFEAQRANNLDSQPFGYDDTLVIWNAFLREYLGTDDEALIAKADAQVEAYSMLRTTIVRAGRPGPLPQSVQSRKQTLLEYCARLEPVCF